MIVHWIDEPLSHRNSSRQTLRFTQCISSGAGFYKHEIIKQTSWPYIQLDPAGYGPPFSSMEIISSMATGHCTAPMAEVKLTTSLSTGSPAVAPLVAQIARHRQAKSGQVTNPSGHVKKSQCMEHNTSRTSRTMENTCGVKKR